jgi:AcrR family transcriptional regulator
MNDVNKDLKIRDRNPRGEGDRLRATLLDAATQLLAESKNPDEVSVRAVTARAGVSPTALYLHFESREELLRAVSEECFAQLERALWAAQAEAGSDPRDQLKAHGHAYLRFAREHPGHYAVLFEHHLGVAKPEKGPTIGMEVFEILVGLIRRLGVDDDEAFDYSVLLWMALHGRASVARAMPGFPFPDEDRYVDLWADQVPGRL